jgi:zinc protease
VEQQSEILRNITKAEIDAIAKKRLPINNMIITVVGNKQRIKAGLERLGYEIVELDKEGDPVGTTGASGGTDAPPAKVSGGKGKE